DREAWAFAQRLDTAQAFEAYLNAHCPGGHYCGFARAAIASKATRREQQQTTGDRDGDTADTKPQRVEALVSPTLRTVEQAKALAESWGRRRYRLQSGSSRTDPCRRNKTFSRLNKWQPIQPALSPISIEGMPSTSASHALTSTSFDIIANLAVYAAEDEFYLVESKQHVGPARGFCRVGGLDRSLFSNLIANAAHFAGQRPQTLSYGYDQLGLVEYASALVTLHPPDGQRMCLAFIGIKGRLSRIDGFFCRGIGQTVDASEVEAILSRIRIDGVLG
ncbi:MAG: hypothetical protein ACR2P3_06075, partial [Geminicoccaceae bacterium]